MRSIGTSRALVIVAALAATASVAAGCGGKSKAKTTTAATTAAAAASSSVSSDASTAAAGATIAVPAGIKKAKKLVFCSDITYPPEEFYKGTTPVGSDIEIGTAIAKRFGVKARFDNTGFDGIIAALISSKCDAIISGMNDTTQRAKQVDFVDYLSVGQSFMVLKGNPDGIKAIADLAGRTVSVEASTTNADFLKAQSKKLTDAGKKAITVKTFPKDTDAANALKTKKVDAYFGDSPVVAYYIKNDATDFDFGGTPVNPIAVGIATAKTKKGKALNTAIDAAVKAMYADGTMKTILAKWNMSDSAITS